jgi:uncharacterized protein (DUF362 family)
MEEIKIKNSISIVKTDIKYPEFPYEQNSSLYTGLLDLLEGLGLPRENPFSYYISSGQTALIKPNWVRDRNPLGFNIESLISHSALIKYLIDLLSIAMNGKGKIIIADAPLQNCHFENLKKQNHIEEIIKNAKNKFPNLDILLEDWRVTTMGGSSQNIQNYRLTEDGLLNEYEIVDLGKESFLEEISEYADRFRVTKYKPSLMLKHHAIGRHEYLISKRIFEADFIINLPKMKTHIKAGLTGAMKNLVGINGHKEFLPHHIKGSAQEGGDNYAKYSWLKSKYENLYDYTWENINDFSSTKRRLLLKFLQILWKLSILFGADKISAGSWSGNDTIWRTTLDLNHIAYFGHKKHFNILNIVDGIVAGEGEGPLEPTPKCLGILLAGENPAYVDAIVAKMMGYDFAKIPTIYNAVYNSKSKFSGVSLEDFSVELKEGENRKKISFAKIPNFNFKKPQFWQKV